MQRGEIHLFLLVSFSLYAWCILQHTKKEDYTSMIVIVQEGTHSCTKTIIPATQAPLHHGAKVPMLVHDRQLCTPAGESTGMRRIVLNMNHPCVFKMTQLSAAKWLVALRCTELHRFSVNMTLGTVTYHVANQNTARLQQEQHEHEKLS